MCSCYRPQRSCEGYVFTGVCLSTGGVCSRGVSGPGGRLLLGGLLWGVWSSGDGIPACTEADPPPEETATAADGTHPTGMHSCIESKRLYIHQFEA